VTRDPAVEEAFARTVAAERARTAPRLAFFRGLSAIVMVTVSGAGSAAGSSPLAAALPWSIVWLSGAAIVLIGVPGYLYWKSASRNAKAAE